MVRVIFQAKQIGQLPSRRITLSRMEIIFKPCNDTFVISCIQ